MLSPDQLEANTAFIFFWTIWSLSCEHLQHSSQFTIQVTTWNMKAAVNAEYPVLPWTIIHTSFNLSSEQLITYPYKCCSTYFCTHPESDSWLQGISIRISFSFLPLSTSSSLCTLTPRKKSIKQRWVTIVLTFWTHCRLLTLKSRFFPTNSAYLQNNLIEEEEEVKRIVIPSLRSLAVTFGGLSFPFLPVLLHHLSPGGFKTFEVHSEYGAVVWGTSFGPSALDTWSFNFRGINTVQTGTQYHKTQKKSVPHMPKCSKEEIVTVSLGSLTESARKNKAQLESLILLTFPFTPGQPTK